MRPIRHTLTQLGIAIIALLYASSLWAQPRSQWRTHLSYTSTSTVADADTRVFGVASGGALYSIAKNNPTDIRYYDRTNGLSEAEIQDIGYDQSSKTLVIYYKSGNIDLLTSDAVTNLTAIRDNSRLMNKSLSRMSFGNGRIYLAGGFGIVVIDPTKAVVLSTYLQGKNVVDIALPEKDKIWAFFDGQLSEGVETDNLQDPSYWHVLPLPITPKDKVLGLGVFAGSPLVHLDDNRLVQYKLNTAQADTIISPHQPHKQYAYSLSSSPHGTMVVADGICLLFRAGEEKYQTYKCKWPSRIAFYSSPNEAWLAMKEEGIARLNLSTEGANAEIQEIDTGNSPVDDRYFYSTFSQGRYFAVSGARGSYRFGIPFGLKIFDGKKWLNFTQKEVGQVRDATSVAVDPRDPKHYFVATHGEGLIEFRNDKYYTTHNESNSPLKSAIDNETGYCRVSALCYDHRGNLWMAQNSVPSQTILVLDKDGNWIVPKYPQIGADNSYTQMIPVGSDVHWLAIYHEATGAYAFDTSLKGAASAESASVHISSLSDRNGKMLPSNIFHAMALDRKGVLWIGSNSGLCSIHSPAMALKRTPIASRPVAGVEPNLFYVLDNVPVKAIAIDRLNHKWIATSGNGLLLMNEDCTEILRQYNMGNSPLLSDEVVTLSLDEKNGILYIGTDKGLMALNTGSDVATDSALDKIFAYPNPLRPEQPDAITIEGLKAGCIVKIINMQGQLVYESQIIDDRLVWQARHKDGTRVDSGVYTVLVFDPETKSKTRLSIAVLK